MKMGIICVVYVYSSIFFGPDGALLDAEMQGLGMSSREHSHSFELLDEGEVGEFISIRIKKTVPVTCELTQMVLIDNGLNYVGLGECCGVSTPAEKRNGCEYRGSTV
jgi:hypothetical protein